jgi:hypothetical protein
VAQVVDKLGAAGGPRSGKIMADLAAAVALGGDRLADTAVLREQPWRLTIRDFLAHWGQTRRTGTVNALIRSDLADKGLTTPAVHGKTRRRRDRDHSGRYDILKS